MSSTEGATMMTKLTIDRLRHGQDREYHDGRCIWGSVTTDFGHCRCQSAPEYRAEFEGTMTLWVCRDHLPEAIRSTLGFPYDALPAHEVRSAVLGGPLTGEAVMERLWAASVEQGRRADARLGELE